MHRWMDEYGLQWKRIPMNWPLSCWSFENNTGSCDTKVHGYADDANFFYFFV